MSRPRLLDLGNDVQTIIDEADWPRVDGMTLYLGVNGYVYYSNWSGGRSDPKTLHQFLLGRTPGMQIDHINGNKLDNRRCNLRVTTAQVNQANRKQLNSNNTSGHRGVVVRMGTRRPYIAQIMVNRKMLYLGSFLTVEEAVEARRAAELQHYGEECPR
jgi:hypothetical protein